MARPAGIEPTTHCLEGSCSIHLSYGRKQIKIYYANLIRNASSGKYHASFQSHGKLIWRGLDTEF